jgi:hypothetical protein
VTEEASSNVKASTEDAPTMLAATVVKRGREAEFEEFVLDVIVEAEQRVKVGRQGRWRLLRPAKDQPQGATRAYMFLFYGDVPSEDWELDRLFDKAYGPEQGARHLQHFEDLIEGEQSVYAFDGEVNV